MSQKKHRLIDANVLIQKLQEAVSHKGLGAAIAGIIIQFIEAMPTIYAEEVTHCKDCQLRDTPQCPAAHWEDDYKTEFDDNGFCSGGKLK